MRQISNTTNYLIKLAIWLKFQLIKTVIKQHNHQPISWLSSQIRNFDIKSKIRFLMPNHNNRPYLVSVLTPVNWKYIEISLSLLENKYWRQCPITRIIPGQLEYDSITIQYIKTSNTCLQDIYAKSLYIGLSKFI